MSSPDARVQQRHVSPTSRTYSRRLRLETLERRDLLAPIYLPDSFTNGGAVGTSFNTGEQMFYRGPSDQLQFAFGNTTAGRSYNGSGWNLAKVADLVGTPLPDLGDQASLYEGIDPNTGNPQLNLVYGDGFGALINVSTGPWTATEILADGANSHHAVSFHGGRQVLYVGDDNHLHAVLSGDNGQSWFDADLHEIVGIDGTSSANVISGSGIGAVQVGSYEEFLYRRSDGRLGVIRWNGTAWSTYTLGSTNVFGYVAPRSGGFGFITSISYDYTGNGGAPNVGWVMYRDQNNALRALWTVQQGIWLTAELSSEPMATPPELAYDPVNRQLSAVYQDSNRHLRLVQETPGDWINRDLHSGVITNPLTSGSREPDLYWRPALPGTPAGWRVVYADINDHVLNLTVGSGTTHLLFDSTAYNEGYRRDFGYGMVNAALAVAYASNSQIVLTGGPVASWNLEAIHAPEAWAAGATGANTAVFVIDSGVDGANNDMHTLPGRNTVAGNADVTDINGHGTGIAGIINGANDGSGVTGVAYDSDVIPIKVGDGSPASETALVDALDFALDYTLPGGYPFASRVITMGLATTQSGNSAAILTNLRNKMYEASPYAVLVTPAGNRGLSSPDIPARFEVGFGIVAGAINQSFARWSPSNGTSADNAPYNYLLAPGVDVTISALVGSSGDDWNTAQATATSVAAAHIAGVAALILDVNPGLSPWDVESILIASATPITQSASTAPPNIPTTLHWA